MIVGSPLLSRRKKPPPVQMIVLAGKGHETYQEIMGIKRPFDEKVIVSDLLLDIRKEQE